MTKKAKIRHQVKQLLCTSKEIKRVKVEDLKQETSLKLGAKKELEISMPMALTNILMSPEVNTERRMKYRRAAAKEELG